MISATPPFPKVIQLETTIHCNSSCDFCRQKEVTRTPPFMEERIWKKIIDESSGRGITYRPFLQNEPLMDKRMPEIVRYIRRDQTSRVELNTNGGLMFPDKAETLLEAGLDVVRFSIDGFSKEVAEKIRPISYETVKNNAEKFIELATQASHPCKVEIRMIDIDDNRHEQAAYLEYWNGLGADTKVLPLYNWPWTGQTGFVPAPCPKIRQEMFFVVDGRAVLCCWDFAARGVIGDVGVSTVSEIWNSEINRNYREILERGERGKIELCSRCDGFAHLLKQKTE